jgi:hypothetical protein
MFCMETATHTEDELMGLSVWLVYGWRRYIGSLLPAFSHWIHPWSPGMHLPSRSAHHHPESAP